MFEKNSLPMWEYAGIQLRAATKTEAIARFRERLCMAKLPRGACVKKVKVQ